MSLDVNVLGRHFKGAKDFDIFFHSWIPTREPIGTLVIAHGIGEHSGRYDHVGRYYADRGIAVYALDHQGHGRSGGVTGTVESFADFLDDVESLLEFARREQAGLPLVLLGHSMGGLIVTAYLLEKSLHPDFAILSGPAIVPLLDPNNRTIDPTRLSRAPEVWKQYLEDPLVLKERVREDIYPKLIEGVSLLPGRAVELELPLLLIHGADDQLCSAEGAKQYVESSSSDDVTVHIYEEGRHEMLNEINRDEVLADIWSWIEPRISRTREWGEGS